MIKKQTRIEALIIPAFFVLAFFFAAEVQAEEHYVTQHGAGLKNGTSLENAWSLVIFNGDLSVWDTDVSDDKKIGPGDTVYFSGLFDAEIKPLGDGTAQSKITLDGYKSGSADMHNYTCSACAKISRAQKIGYYAFNIVGRKYLVIQDFEMQELNHGVRMAGGSSYLYIKRNLIHDTLDDCIIIYDGSKNMVVGGARGDGNHLYDCGSGTGAADVVSSNADYVVVSYNWMEGGLKKDRGIDGVTLNHYSNNYLIEYNLIENHNDEIQEAPYPYNTGAYGGLEGRGEDATDVKHQCHSVVIRGNVMRNHYFQGGTHIHGRGFNVFIYGNYIANNGEGVLVFNNKDDFSDTEQPSRNIHIWSNIFEGNFGPAVSFNRSQEGGSVPREPHHLFVTNNVIAVNVIENDPYNVSNVSSVTSAVMWFAGASSYRKDQNNIFYKNRVDEAPYHHEVFRYDDWRSFDQDPTCAHSHNTYFDPRGISYLRWYTSSTEYTSRTLEWVKTNTKLAKESYDTDPGMLDPANSKYWAKSSGSQMVGTGVPLTDELLPGKLCFLEDCSYSTQMSYSTGLGVETDWSANPPKVVWKTFNPNSWDRGAYVYSGSTPTYIPGDQNHDGKVDIADYSMFIQDFGKTGTNLPADLNKNGQVEIGDYSIFISNFGKTS